MQSLCPLAKNRLYLEDMPVHRFYAHHTLFNPEAHVEEYERLKQAIHDVDEDIRKAEGGNKAAGTRVRKAMQDVKNIAQEIRKKVLEFRTD